jgi:hypothetical protein
VIVTILVNKILKMIIKKNRRNNSKTNKIMKVQLIFLMNKLKFIKNIYHIVLISANYKIIPIYKIYNYINNKGRRTMLKIIRIIV